MNVDYGKDRNPLLDFYIAAWVAGKVRHPVFYINQMPSREGKSLTSFRFRHATDTLLISGDTTSQALRNYMSELFKQNKTWPLNLIIIEDASKIRQKTIDDFFALIAQFSTGNVSVNQFHLNMEFETHTSIVINSPPFFTRSVERMLTEAGSGDRFDILQYKLGNEPRKILAWLGIYNKCVNRISPVILPDVQEGDFPTYVLESKYNGSSENDINFRYACFCAGIPENLIDVLRAGIIKNANWSGFWQDQLNIEEKK